MPTKPSKAIKNFINKNQKRDYTIKIKIPEFTCLCPMTGQPDFATIYIEYIPSQLCVELKSLKLYIWSYRNEGVFHEAVTNQILDDLVNSLHPKYIEVKADFYVRGGIYTAVIADYSADGFTKPK